jgi:hypothetical protein
MHKLRNTLADIAGRSMSINRIPRVLLQVSRLIKGTADPSTEMPFNGVWHINLVQRVDWARRQEHFLAGKANTKNLNGEFDMVVPISKTTSETFRRW